MTHARHWMHAPCDIETVRVPGDGDSASIAPVGHAWAHTSHAVQRPASAGPEWPQ